LPAGQSKPKIRGSNRTVLETPEAGRTPLEIPLENPS
jgi:hypothetical protein